MKLKLFSKTGLTRKWQLVLDWLPLSLSWVNKTHGSKSKPAKRKAATALKKNTRSSLSDHISVLWPYSRASLIAVVVGLSGASYFGLQIQSANDSADKLERVTTFSIPAPVQKVTDTKKKGLSRSEPTQVKVSSVGIDTKIINVGQLADGTMETPPLFEPVAGWYKHSPTPGEIGPAVIVGHVDTYKGPAIFWRLRDVKAGDIVEVTRQDNKVVKFKVEALKQFEQNNFPTEEVYGNINSAGLRLITCGGTYNAKTGHYTENTVIFATMISEPPAR